MTGVIWGHQIAFENRTASGIHLRGGRKRPRGLCRPRRGLQLAGSALGGEEPGGNPASRNHGAAHRAGVFASLLPGAAAARGTEAGAAAGVRQGRGIDLGARKGWRCRPEKSGEEAGTEDHATDATVARLLEPVQFRLESFQRRSPAVLIGESLKRPQGARRRRDAPTAHRRASTGMRGRDCERGRRA